jgi:hypothetical protein
MPRLCAFAEQTSLPLLTNGGWKPLPPRSCLQCLWLEEKDGQIHRRSRWFVHNAGCTATAAECYRLPSGETRTAFSRHVVIPGVLPGNPMGFTSVEDNVAISTTYIS